MLNVLLKLLNTINKLCVTVVVLIVTLFSLILISPIFITRLIVSYLGVLGPDLNGLVDVKSSNFAVDDIYTDPKSTILYCVLHKGNLSIEALRLHLQKRVIDNPLNEKLKQYPYQWMGFMFWRWEKDFDISQHVQYYEPPDILEDSEVNFQQLKEIESELQTKPFTLKRSPWEVLIIRNFISGSSNQKNFVFLLRIHHCIGDGISFINNFGIPMCFDDVDKVERFIETQTKSQKQLGLGQIVTVLKMMIALPYQAADMMMKVKEKNIWSNSGRKRTNNYFYCVSERISMEVLKEIKQMHNVGVTAVIFSAFTAGIREAMMKQNGKVPEIIHCMKAVPMPGHPETFSNHFTGVSIGLPTGVADPITRLLIIQENIHKFKTTMMHLLPFYFSCVIGALFPVLNRFCLKFVTPTILVSNLPGVKNEYSLLGSETVGHHVSAGNGFGQSPVALTAISHPNGLWMKISVNTAVIDCQIDVDDICKTMEKELLLLKSC